LPNEAQTPAPPRLQAAAWIAVAYVAVVLLVDGLAAQRVSWPINWGIFDWHGVTFYHWAIASGSSHEEAQKFLHLVLRVFWFFKFIFWFALPLALCLRTLDRGYFGFKRWRPVDYGILLFGVCVGVAVLFLIPLMPSLQAYYPSLSALDASEKWSYFGLSLIRTASWLLGWEFLHRYVLVRHLRDTRYAWLIIPFLEAAYHIQKAWIEMLGMFLFSLVATRWAIVRRNMLLPFLVHLAIELALPLLQIML